MKAREGGILDFLSVNSTTWSWFVSWEQLVDDDRQDFASISSYWHGPPSQRNQRETLKIHTLFKIEGNVSRV